MAPGGSKKKPKFESSDSEEESQISPEREKSFYKGEDAFRIGSFRVRCFFNAYKFAWMVNFKKKMTFNEKNPAVKESHFSFPGSDIPFVVAAIRGIVQELLLHSAGNEEKSVYCEDADNFRDPNFWSRSFCKKSPSGAIIIRGFVDGSNALSVRILCPKNSTHATWLGSSGTLSLMHALEFAELLEGFQRFIQNSDTDHHKHLKESKDDPSKLILTRLSPTRSDIEALNDSLNTAAEDPEDIAIEELTRLADQEDEHYPKLQKHKA